MKLSRQNRSRLAWIKSFSKTSWRFEDYPLDYIDQGECPPNLPGRLQHKRWRADLVNWYAVSGLGDSKEAALADAKQKFADWKTSGEKMWRPGTGPGIVFAAKETPTRYPELSDDFIHKVLNLQWAWISDFSTLWDFHTENDNDAMYLRIGEIYGVDVSSVPNARLMDIFAEIMNQIGSFPEDPVLKAIRLTRDARDRHVAGLPALSWNPIVEP
ncbi:hypothetical protein [Tunturibacter empetritectus]|uniref:Uncharacterized protein n=1 Tax=Tunturiibacter lichenicola TaxID=2051959 RepID=A0A7W8N7J8_9BACT|nr:hypothetical protein [Edaphobacter lichenicola]MBB5346115.1 hypothetical protein [Edaphobacter lichenicola]